MSGVLDPSKRPRLEPRRMKVTCVKLMQLGWAVFPGPDDKSFHLTSPNANEYNFWPYTGWFAGKKKGRGFKNLLRADNGS